jgi:hypothetical protein
MLLLNIVLTKYMPKEFYFSEPLFNFITDSKKAEKDVKK